MKFVCALLWLSLACNPKGSGPRLGGVGETGEATVVLQDTAQSDDSGERRDTGDGPTSDPSWACTTSPAINPAALPEPAQHSEGLRYRVVEVETDTFEHFFVIVLYPPSAYRSAYDAGAPVVVTSMQSIGIGTAWALEPRSYFPMEMGVVEVQPLHAGWTAGGQMTSGVHDGAGPTTADALTEAVRFATGDTVTTTGHTLRDLVNREICPGKVVVLGQSSGGITLANALSRRWDVLGERILGVAFFETPSMPGFVVADSGFMAFDSAPLEDADGNGVSWDDGRNPAFGDCALDSLSCALDLSALAWSLTTVPSHVAPVDMSPGPPGLLYLDRNGNRLFDVDPNGHPDLNKNGWIDADEDYFFLPYQATDESGKKGQMYSPQVLQGAVAAGVLSTSAWPEQVARLDENSAFWAQRDVVSMVAGLPAGFPAVVAFRERDHAIPIGAHPHMQVLYSALEQGGANTRFNMPLAVAHCLVDGEFTADWGGGTPFGLVDDPADLLVRAIPDVMAPRIARAAAALSVFWDIWGPFDACPAALSSR